MNLNKRDMRILAAVYSATDCSNEVFGYAMLHHSRSHIANALVTRGLLLAHDGCVRVDGDGFHAEPERIGRGYRLTMAGYEALTEWMPGAYPATCRRFASLTPATATEAAR